MGRSILTQRERPRIHKKGFSTVHLFLRFCLSLDLPTLSIISLRSRDREVCSVCLGLHSRAPISSRVCLVHCAQPGFLRRARVMLLSGHGASRLGKALRRPTNVKMSDFQGTSDLASDAMRATMAWFRGGRAS
jgi:hypothetical protein